MSHPEGPQESWVRVDSNGAQLLLGATFQRVGQHEHLQARVPEPRRDLVRERLELLGDDADRGLLQLLDEDGVVDTPRRARSSVAEADDPALDET
jgi:hypothetical protein